MNEYNKPIVATIISVFLSWMLSKTNHVPASITSPAASRKRTTSALNTRGHQLYSDVINQTAGGDETIPYLGGVCLSRYGEADRENFLVAQALLAAGRNGRPVFANGRRAAWAPCFGLRFAYTALRHCGRRSRTGAACGLCDRLISSGERLTFAAEFSK